MSTLPHQIHGQQAAQPQPQKQRFRKAKGSDILASATIIEGQSAVIAEDIYNEPVRTTRNSSTVLGRYVPFFDEQNSFAKQLLAICNNSPTLRRVINDKVNMAIGDGFNVYSGVINPMLTFLNETKQNIDITDRRVYEINNLLLNVNLNNETLQDVLKKGFTDYFSLGNCFFELVRTNTMDGIKTYIYHIPAYMVAFKKMEEDMVKEVVGIYETWEKDITTIDQIREVNIFPKVSGYTEEDGTVTERSIICIQNYAPGYSYWGLPDWIACKHYAELEYRAARYNINEFENGFIPSSIVQFYGNMTEEEASRMMRDFKNSYTGTKNHKKVFAQVVRDERLKANVQTIETDKQGDYIELLRLCAQNIVSASGWTMSAAGFATSGVIGTNQQLRSEIAYLQNKVIQPIQNLFCQNVIQPYLNYISEYAPQVADISLAFSNSLPVSFMGDIDIKAVLTVDEQREILGFKPLQTPITPTTNA